MLGPGSRKQEPPQKEETIARLLAVDNRFDHPGDDTDVDADKDSGRSGGLLCCGKRYCALYVLLEHKKEAPRDLNLLTKKQLRALHRRNSKRKIEPTSDPDPDPTFVIARVLLWHEQCVPSPQLDDAAWADRLPWKALTTPVPPSTDTPSTVNNDAGRIAPTPNTPRRKLRNAQQLDKKIASAAVTGSN